MKRIVACFWPELRAQRRPLVASVLLGLIASAFAVLAPWPLKLLIDHVAGDDAAPAALAPYLTHGSSRAVLFLGGAFLAAAVAAVCAGAGQKVAAARARERLTVDVRRRMLDHVSRLPGAFDPKRRSGDLVLRVVGDVNLVARFLTKTAPTGVRHLGSVVLTLAVMFVVAPEAAWFAVVLLPLLVLLARRYAGPLAAAARAKRKREGDISGLAQEIVGGLARSWTTEETNAALRRFGEANRESLAAGVAHTVCGVRMERAMQIANGAAVAAVTVIGGLLVVDGRLSVGTLTVIVAYLTQLLKPVEKVNELASAMTRGLAAGERLLHLLGQCPAVVDHPDATTLGRASGELTLRGVGFTYPGRLEPALRDVDMTFVPGSVTVISGESGAGKSTLLALLARAFDPAAGRIVLDGRPLAAYTTASLRAQFAFVAQNPHFFASTIRDALGGADDAARREALALVRLDGLIDDLPDGFASYLGEDGVNLSGGQRRRLALARAFLLDRPIVVLDEPLANIDEESAQAVLSALARLRVGRTCIVVSHRPEVAARADTVYWLGAGTVTRRQHRMAAP